MSKSKIRDRKKELHRLRNHRFTDSVDGQTRSKNATYWYIWGITPLGSRVCRGPYNTEEEAWNYLYSKGMNGEVHGLRTYDQAAATRHLKELDAQKDGVTIDAALQRVRHKGADLD